MLIGAMTSPTLYGTAVFSPSQACCFVIGRDDRTQLHHRLDANRKHKLQNETEKLTVKLINPRSTNLRAVLF